MQDKTIALYFDFINLNEEFKNLEAKNFYKYFIKAQDRLNLDKKNKIFKTHSCLGKIGDYKFTDRNNTLGFIYLIRDPRSVVISMTYQLGISLEEATDLITNENNFAIEKGNNLRTLWSSWRLNYLSWKKSPYPRLIIKYEDLKINPIDTFKKLLIFLSKYLEINIDENIIKETILKCDFDKVKKEEIDKGFIEKVGKEFFFRKGIIDEWKFALPFSLRSKIEKEFEVEMKELKYI